MTGQVVTKQVEEQSVEQIEQCRSAAFYSTPDFILVLDRYSRILDANPAALKKMKRSLPEARNRVAGNYLSNESRDILLTNLARAFDNKTVVQSLIVENPNPYGDNLFYELDLIPVDDGAVLAVAHEKAYKKTEDAQTSAIYLALEKKASQLSLLNKIGQEITSAADTEQALQNTAGLIHSLFGYYHVAIFTNQQTGSGAVLRVCAGVDPHPYHAGQCFQPGEGLIGEVLQNRRPILVNEIDKPVPIDYQTPAKFLTRSELAVPIQHQDRLIGVLDIHSPVPNGFGGDDIHSMETIASQLAVAVSNGALIAQVQEQLQAIQQTEELLRIQNDALAATSQARDFQDALAFTLETLKGLNIFDSGSIYMLDSSGGMKAMAHSGLTPEFAAAVSILPPEANKTRFVMRGKPGFLAYDSLEYDWRIPELVRQREAMLSVAVFPIFHQNKIIACLTLGSHVLAEISQPARRITEAISRQLGTTISRLKAEYELSVRDTHNHKLLEASPDTMFLLSREGCILAAKKENGGVNMLPPVDVLGHHIGELLPPDVATKLIVMLHTTLESRCLQEFRFQINFEPGQAQTYQAWMSISEDETVVTVVRNITHCVHKEADLVARIQELETACAKLTTGD